MCLRFQQRIPKPKFSESEQLALSLLLDDLFGGPVEIMPGFRSQGNIAFTDPALVVPNGPKTERYAEMMRFGLVPYYTRDIKTVPGGMYGNARKDTLQNKKARAYVEPFKRRRCLIPVSAFYEFREVGPKNKVMHAIYMRDEPMFCLAGLWDSWRDANGEPLNSFSIITTEPNELVSQLHDRMPAIMPRDKFDLWLDPDLDDPDMLADMLQPYPPGEMAYIAYAKAANRSAEKDEAKIMPAEGAVEVRG